MTRESQRFAELKKKKIIAAGCFLTVIFFITILKGGAIFPPQSEIIVNEEEGFSGTVGADADTPGALAVEIQQIVVDLAGAVSRPGILILPQGSRVYQALEEAGGPTAQADLREVNLAAELLDGEKLYIPCAEDYAVKAAGQEGEAAKRAAPAAAGGGAGAFAAKININTADLEELQKIKGVGPSTAQRILDYRKENGRFKSIEDIQKVKGIGAKTFEKMKAMISVT